MDNTVALANFDILKMDGIQDPLININSLTDIDIEETYFQTAIVFINEQNTIYTNTKKKLYKSIYEASSYRIILESFSDFYISVKAIIDKFLKFMKDMFSKFLATLCKLIESEHPLKKYKNYIDNFNDDDSFIFNGFNYTFSDDIPLPQAALEYNNSLFDQLWAERNSDLNTDTIKNATSSINLEEDCAIFRGIVIGKSEKIYITDYSSELFCVYRNEKTTTEDITATPAVVKESKKRFFSYNKVRTSLNQQYKQVERSYNDIEDQLKDLVKRNGDLNAKAFINKLPEGTSISSVNGNVNLDGLTMSEELMAQIDIYTKVKIEQIREYSNIHLLAFSAKLDAIKNCFIQDKYIMYRAIEQVKKREG